MPGLLLRFVYLAFCAVLRLVVRRRDAVGREAELLVLRHEVAVLRSQARSSPHRLGDRALFAACARLLEPDRRRRLIVTPATLVRWHHGLGRH